MKRRVRSQINQISVHRTRFIKLAKVSQIGSTLQIAQLVYLEYSFVDLFRCSVRSEKERERERERERDARNAGTLPRLVWKDNNMNCKISHVAS